MNTLPKTVEHWVVLKGDDSYEIKAQPHPAMRGFTKLIAYVEEEQHAVLICRAPQMDAQIQSLQQQNAEQAARIEELKKIAIDFAQWSAYPDVQDLQMEDDLLFDHFIKNIYETKD